jgi:hypothetical protein
MTTKIHLHDFSYPTEAMLEAHALLWGSSSYTVAPHLPVVTITHELEHDTHEHHCHPDAGEGWGTDFDRYIMLVDGFQVTVDGCKISGRFRKPIYIGEVHTDAGDSDATDWDCAKVCDDDLVHAISEHITAGDGLVGKIKESYASEI